MYAGDCREFVIFKPPGLNLFRRYPTSNQHRNDQSVAKLTLHPMNSHDLAEPILQPSSKRFVLYPIEHHDVRCVTIHEAPN